MAIIDGVKNAVTAQVAARANKAVRAGLKKVSGNLLGISTTSDGPQLGAAAPRASTNKFSTKNLAYPLDVENNPKQGHLTCLLGHIVDETKLLLVSGFRTNSSSPLIKFSSTPNAGTLL